MSETPSSEHTSGATKPNWNEQQLPPVKPPTAGLLMQLFLIPMIIVSIIVSVWLMFGWLAESGTNPEQLASSLEQLNKGSWQDAHRLSNMLRDPRETALRKNGPLAARLSETLTQLIANESATDDERRKLAMWLSSALGHFEVEQGISGLLRGLTSRHMDVRRAAAEAIASLAGRLNSDFEGRHAEVVTALAEMTRAPLSSDDREGEVAAGSLRSSAAFALGIVGGADSLEVLATLLGDGYPDVRYNAAVGLARHGDPRAEKRLLEMIAIDNDESVKFETNPGDRKWKQNLVILNGLRAIRDMARVNPASLTPELVERVRQLKSEDGLSNPIQLAGDDVLRSVQ